MRALSPGVKYADLYDSCLGRDILTIKLIIKGSPLPDANVLMCNYPRRPNWREAPESSTVPPHVREETADIVDRNDFHQKLTYILCLIKSK